MKPRIVIRKVRLSRTFSVWMAFDRGMGWKVVTTRATWGAVMAELEHLALSGQLV